MKKFVLSIIFVFGIFYSANSQSVDLATGAPSVYIPLYTATSGSLSLPIGLSYNVSGVGVAELPSEVGLSWRLIAGGSITYVKRGINDYYNFEGFEGLEGGTVEGDGEPDLYIVEISGNSYQFLYDSNNDSFFSYNKTNLKLEPIVSDNYYFKLTDETGTKYYFEKLITNYDFTETYNDYNGFYLYDNNMSEKWFLTKIKSCNNVDSIELSYDFSSEDITLLYTGLIYTKTKIINECNTTSYEASTKSEQALMQIRLDKIITENETLDFDISDITDEGYVSPYGESYSNWTDFDVLTKTDEVLKNIEIKNKEDELIKKIIFEYNYPSRRTLLNEIKTINSENDNYGSYTFDYKPIYYLRLDGNNSDFWGYLKQHTGALYEYENRLPDENADQGMLLEIRYPKGGYTKFTYENNTYSMNDGWEDTRWQDNIELTDLNSIIGPGVRVCKKIDFDGKNQIITKYKYEDDGISNGRLTIYPVLDYSIDDYGVDCDNDEEDNFTLKDVSFCTSSDLNFESGRIYYEKVTEAVVNELNENINGYTENYFYVDKSLSILDNPSQNFPYPMYVNSLRNGTPESAFVYNKEDKILSSKINSVSIENTSNFIEGAKIVSLNNKDTYGLLGFYKIFQKNVKLNSVQSKTFDKIDQNTFSSDIVNYEYNNINGYLSRSYYTTSTDDTYSTYYYYPGDAGCNSIIHNELSNRNFISVPVKTVVTLNSADNIISGQEIFYRNIPDETSEITDDTIVADYLKEYNGSYWITTEYYDLYDSKLNLLQSHTRDNLYSSTIYGYNNTLPVAVVTNAKYSEIYFNNFEDYHGEALSTDLFSKTGEYSWEGSFSFNLPVSTSECSLSYWYSENGTEWNLEEQTISAPSGQSYPISGHTYIDDVRVYPIDAYMTTTTYKPLVGATSVTDANNNSIFYDYDSWGRVVELKDKDLNKISTYEYNDVEFTPIDFEIIGGENVIAGQDFILEAIVDGIIPSKGISTWEWYKDESKSEIIGTGRTDTFKICETTTFYVRPVIDGFAYDYQEYNVTPHYDPETNITFSESALYFDNADGTQTVDVTSNLKDCDWFVTASSNLINISNITNSSFTVSCDHTDYEMQGYVSVNTQAGYNVSLDVTNYALLQISLSHLSDPNRIKATVNGGRGNYTYKWYLDDSPYPTSITTDYINYTDMGNADFIKCEVTDGYQTVSATIEI